MVVTKFSSSNLYLYLGVLPLIAEINDSGSSE